MRSRTNAASSFSANSYGPFVVCNMSWAAVKVCHCVLDGGVGIRCVVVSQITPFLTPRQIKSLRKDVSNVMKKRRILEKNSRRESKRNELHKGQEPDLRKHGEVFVYLYPNEVTRQITR